MRNPRIGLLHRRLRQRARLTQAQLGGRAKLGRAKVGRIEAGDLERLRHGEIECSFGALGARVELRVLYNGAAADRVLDELHARLVGMFVRVLGRYGWEPRVETSFSEFGERGSIDVLAWNAETRALLVVEVKSEMGAIEGTLRPMDVKQRLAARVATDRFGWRPRFVARILVLPEERTARRAVERHADVLRAALPATSRELRRWLAQPAGSIAGIWFLSAGGPSAGGPSAGGPSAGGRSAGGGARPGGMRNPSSIRRVRAQRS